MGSSFLTLAAGCVLGLGVYLCIEGAGNFRRAWRSRKWTVGTGRIDGAEFRVSYTQPRTIQPWRAITGGNLPKDFFLPDGAPRYRMSLRFHYFYDAAGERRRGSQLFFGSDEAVLSRGDAAAYLQKYRIGQSAKVFHDPVRPDESVLVPGKLVGALGGLMVGMILTGIGIIGTR